MNKIVFSEDESVSKMVVEVDGVKQFRTYHREKIYDELWEYVPDIKENERIVSVLGSNTYKIVTISNN